MTSKSSIFRTLAIVSLATASAASQAALVAFDTQAGFLSAVTSASTDTFDDLDANVQGLGFYSRRVGPYAYNVSVSQNDGSDGWFYNAGLGTDTWLSTTNTWDVITFSGFSEPVRGIGGSFFDSNAAGNFLRGQFVTLVATDSSGESLSKTIFNGSSTNFYGFVSDRALATLTLTAASSAGTDTWPTANNFMLASAAPITSAVPEPGTIALLSLGLGVIFAANRRKQVR